MRTFDATQTAIIASDAIPEISWLFEIDKDGDGDIDYYWSNKSKVWNGNTYDFCITDFSPIRMERNRSEYGINAPPAFNFTISNPSTVLYPSDFSGGNATVRLIMKGDGPALIVGNDSTFAGANNWENVNLSAFDSTGDLTISSNTVNQLCILPDAHIGLEAGRRYRIDFTGSALSGDGFKAYVGGSNQFIGQIASGLNSFDFTLLVGFNGIIIVADGTGSVTVDNITLNATDAESEMVSWNFDFAGVSPIDQTLKFECQSWIQKYLEGVYPNTETFDSLWPSDQNDYSGCVPLIFGTCYIPLHSAFISTDRFYILGPAGPTYIITKSRSPVEIDTVTEWVPASYTFSQSDKAGGDGNNYRAFQLIGTTVTTDPTGNVLYKLWNRIFGSHQGEDLITTQSNIGASFLSLPTKYSRDDTVSLTNPGDVIHYILEDFGIPSALLDATTLAAVTATFTGWGLTWNTGLYEQKDRKTLLASLCNQCHLELIVRDKVYFKVHVIAPVDTITSADTIPDSFNYKATKPEIANCGYTSFPDPSNDVPVSKLTRKLVPAKAATTQKSTIEVDCSFVSSGTVHAQRLGSLVLQRKLLPIADVSFTEKGYMIAVEPDDFITVSDANFGAGVDNTYVILIDSVSYNPDSSISFTGTRFSDALEDFADTVPAGVTVATDTSSNPYQVVLAGPIATGTPTGDNPGIFSGVVRASENVGLSGLVSGGVDWRIWAGDTFANRSIAPFRVDDDGNMYATNAYIEGIVSSSYVYGSSLMTKGTYLASTCAAADSTINVGDTTDFPASGSASFIDSANDRDVFTYTGKTATTLTGCSGVLAHTVSATNKPLVIPPVTAWITSDCVGESRYFGDRGDATIEELVNIGIKAGVAPDYIIGDFGTFDSSRVALRARGKDYGPVVRSEMRTNSTTLAIGTFLSLESVTSGNKGVLINASVSALRGNVAGDTGNATSIIAESITFGHNSTSTPGTTSGVTGLLITPYHKAGAITNSYGIYIDSALTGITPTNYWAIYQEDPNAKNFFAGNAEFSGTTRHTTSLKRRYYHIPLEAANPGGSGATWVVAGANTTGGWRLTNAAWLLRGQADIHADWDGASDIKVGLKFMVNTDNSGGGAGDTVDIQLVARYKGIGDTAVKSQTVENSIVVGASAQYKQFSTEFTINWDEVSNVVEVGDAISININLETDTSEVDDIVITSMELYYNTTHIGIESGDV